MKDNFCSLSKVVDAFWDWAGVTDEILTSGEVSGSATL